MEKYLKEYRRLIITHKIFILCYCTIAALLFLGGMAGIIVCGIRNTDSLLTLFIVLGLAGPVVMWIFYLVCLQWLWDKRFDRQNRDLMKSSLSADEIMELGRKLKKNLFSTALNKRCKELGLERAPEWCVRDDILPKKEDIEDSGKDK